MLTTDVLGCILRVTLILGLGWLAARLMERRSSTTAHRVLIVAGLCALLLPLVTAFVPTWEWTIPVELARSFPGEQHDNQSQTPLPGEPSLRVGHNENQTQFSSGQSPANTLPANDESESVVIPTPVSLPVADLNGDLFEAELTSEGQANALSNSPGSTDASDSATFRSQQSSYGWGSVAIVAWLTGTLLLTAHFLISFRRLQLRIRRSQTASPNIQLLVDKAVADHQIRQRIHTVMTANESMPMACWLGRWTIVLPSNIDAWDNDSCHSAVMHELGHVVRRDAWADYLIHVVGCLLWFHPLAWLLVRNSRRLRELACDEWVLQQTSLDNTTYARCLLQVVERCQSETLTIASAMASPAEFESRLKRLMSASFPGTRRPFVTLFAAMTIGAASLTIATARPVAIEVPVQETTNAPNQNIAVQTPANANDSVAPKVIINRDPAPAEPNISISGIVTNENGKPLAGMQVVLRAYLRGHQYASSFPHDRDVLASTKSDNNGTFRFDSIPIPPRMGEAIDKLTLGKRGAQLLAWGDSRALTWRSITKFQSPDETIALQPEADVTGTVVSALTGQPIAEAVLRVRAITSSTKKLDGLFRDPGDLNLYGFELPFETTSASDGSFRVSNIPPNYRVMFSPRGPAGERGSLIIDTSDNGIESILSGSLQVPVHQSPARFMMAKVTPAIRLRVVDHNGNPVQGGGVQAVDSNRHFAGQAEFDEHGHAILTVNAPGIHDVIYGQDPFKPTMGVRQKIDMQNGELQTVTLTLPNSRLLAGKVVDAETGKPIPGAYVRCSRAEAYPDQKLTDASLPVGSMAVTGTDGLFRLPVTPGKWNLTLRHTINGYLTRPPRHGGKNAPKPLAVTITDGPMPEDVLIRVGQGMTIDGLVLSEQGLPQADTMVRIENSNRAFATKSDEQGKFIVTGMSPYTSSRVSVVTPTGAIEHTIEATPEHPLDQPIEKSINLKLLTGTTLTGRVVYKGQPMPGVQMKLMRSALKDRTEKGVRYFFLAETFTDEDGRYSVSGLRKGDRYRFNISSERNLAVRNWRHQSPYTQTITVEDGTTVKLPDAILVSNGQTLQGQVVDRSGNPVSGITVNARLAAGGIISRPSDSTGQPRTVTNATGRFVLVGLPDEPISLLAYRSNTAGGTVKYTVTKTVEVGATDIRLTLDPKLGSNIEDLDAK